MTSKYYQIFKSDIVDALTSTDAGKPLSANQGRVLNSKVTHGTAAPSVAGNAGDLYVRIIDPAPSGYLKIGTPAELVAFANRVISGETSLHACLTADIDMADTEWTPISGFKGIFDGNGRTISHLSGGEKGGMFTSLSGATIRNCIFSDCTIGSGGTGAASSGCGILCYGAWDSTVIERCAVYNSQLSGWNQNGGLVGKTGSSSTIRNCCTVSTTITSSPGEVGGITSWAYQTGNIENCFVYNSTINTSGGSCGCLIGFANIDNTLIKNCAVYGGNRGNSLTGSSKTGTNCYTSDSITSDIFHTKGFWDGTGVDGTVYLSWDFTSIWEWDSEATLPKLRTIDLSIKTELYTYNGSAWVKIGSSEEA